MVRTKLENLKLEIQRYLGIPYFKNTGKLKNNGENVYVGKGTAKEIALETINLANIENTKLVNFTSQQIYNFQKKHHLGIDCSGLACHLLNYYFSCNLNPRRTSADMLTSEPVSNKINVESVTTGDLIRIKNGAHVYFVIEKTDKDILYVDSSREGRGVRLGSLPISPQLALYRLTAQQK